MEVIPRWFHFRKIFDKLNTTRFSIMLHFENESDKHPNER